MTGACCPMYYSKHYTHFDLYYYRNVCVPFTGKVFPKLKRKGSQLQKSPVGGPSGATNGAAPGISLNRSLDASVSVDDTSIAGQLLSDEDETTDYVFRIITTFKPEHLSELLVFDFLFISLSVTDNPLSFYSHSAIPQTLSSNPITVTQYSLS